MQAAPRQPGNEEDAARASVCRRSRQAADSPFGALSPSGAAPPIKRQIPIVPTHARHSMVVAVGPWPTCPPTLDPFPGDGRPRYFRRRRRRRSGGAARRGRASRWRWASLRRVGRSDRRARIRNRVDDRPRPSGGGGAPFDLRRRHLNCLARIGERRQCFLSDARTQTTVPPSPRRTNVVDGFERS